MNFEFTEILVMISGVVNDAIALIDESFGASILARVINVGFVIGTFWQCCVVIACV